MISHFRRLVTSLLSIAKIFVLHHQVRKLDIATLASESSQQPAVSPVFYAVDLFACGGTIMKDGATTAHKFLVYLRIETLRTTFCVANALSKERVKVHADNEMSTSS